MKIAYYQDSHIYGRNSANRIGECYNDIMQKIREVHKIAKEQKCKKIIHGGDIWENCVVSNLMVDEFVDIVEKYKIPLEVIWGNHDEINGNIETSKGSSLAHICRRSKLINILNDNDDLNEEFTIKPLHYKHGIEDEIKENGIIFSKDSLNSWKIAIVHAFVTEKPFLPQVMHIVYDKIKTNADLILIAHYHHNWNKKVENTEYLDIGCLGRLNINEADIEPSMLILDTEKRSYEIIKLKSAKPGSEIFDLSKIKEIKEFDNNINNFISSLQSTKVQSLSIRGIITDICKENKVEKEVENLIIEKIGECE